MKKDRYAFVAIISDDSDGLSVEFPDLPGCLTCAENGEFTSAVVNAKEALGLHLFGMEQDGDTIPTPTPLNKLNPGKGQTLVLIEVFMPSIRARAKTNFVKKTLSLPAWLAAKADEDGVNCSKLFQDALIKYLNL